MKLEMHVVSITDAVGRIDAPDWLAGAEGVHRQLRPQLPRDYVARMTEVFAGGARMGLVVANQAVLTVAVWRVLENTYEGRRLYVDDLVSDESRRSQGAGKLMLDWLQDQATALGCDVLALDSGVQRAQAHRFYFREGMHIPAFCFRKTLK